MNFHKWLIENKNWQFNEMPISNFQLTGQWGPDAKRAYGYSKQDTGILQNPVAVNKIHKKWSNTHYDFDFYFLRSNKARKIREVGKVSPEWVKQNLEVDIQPREDTITIIFTQNIGTEKIPMTAWTIAHRLGHAIKKENIFQNNFLRELIEDFRELLKEIYGINKYQYNNYQYDNYGLKDQKELSVLAQAVGTMRSARRGTLLNFYEFGYELIAQWIITGHVKFNPIPRSLILRKKMAWGRPAHDMSYSKIDNETHEEWNEILQKNAEKYEYYIDAIFGSIVGNMYVM
jgi:hypothetical protein